MKNIFEVNNLCYSISGGDSLSSSTEKKILENISFTIEREKIIGIAGESGSGKTTLAKILAGILLPSSGELIKNISGGWKNKKTNPVQILFQNTGEILNPLRKIDDVIGEAFKIRFGSSENSLMQKTLEAVNLQESLGQRKGFELSGGEQQRAALARILSIQPEVLILDEPFSAQDPPSQLNMLSLCKSVNQKYKITLICISHNLKALRKICDEVIVMYKGKIVEKGETKNILENPQHPYTKFLLKAEDYSLNYAEIQNEIEALDK